MHLVHNFPDGAELLSHAIAYRFEGIVGKRTDKPYASGPCKFWVKLKNPGWARANARRYLMFEDHKQPELMTERQKTLQKKVEELKRVRDLPTCGRRAGTLRG